MTPANISCCPESAGGNSLTSAACLPWSKAGTLRLQDNPSSRSALSGTYNSLLPSHCRQPRGLSGPTSGSLPRLNAIDVLCCSS